jgi:hypothetical protein
MIDMLMFGAFGFLLGCLLALVLAPPLWNRAVRLTTRRLEATMPISLADIQADKDQLRAEFAIELRKIEVALEKAKEKAARELIEANKRRVEIQMMQTDLANAKGQIQENENANRVLQQTIRRRLPDLDNRLKSAKKALSELEAVNTELRTTVSSQSEALKTARATLHTQRADIDRLRATLETGSASGIRLGKSELRSENQKLMAELSRAQQELARTTTSAEENAFLHRELSRLASQILNAVRTPAPAQMHAQRMVVEVPQNYPEFEARQEPQRHEPEPMWHQANGGGNDAAHESEFIEHAAESAERVDGIAAEQAYAEAHAEPVEGVEHGEGAPAEGHESFEGEEHAEHGAAGEEAAGQESFASRFVSRRAKRRARKEGGTTLSSRLRGLVSEAEAPESRS